MASFVFGLASMSSLSPVVRAATFSWKDASFSYQANATALSRVLEDVFITQQRPIDISNVVRELAPVSGDFKEAPRQLFNDLLRSYGLVDYFDGTTMYVSALSESKSVLRTLSNIEARDVERAARQLGYWDRRFGFNSIGVSRSLKLSGPPAYIERISDVIANLEANAKKSADVSSARMQVHVIPLKHAWAEDVTYNIGGRTTVIRGVANSLRQLVDGVSGPDNAVAVSSGTGFDTPGFPIAPDRRSVSALGALLGSRTDDGVKREVKSPLPDSMSNWNRSSGGDVQLGQRPGAYVRVVGDSRMNAVVIMAPADMLSTLENVVHELDVEPELVQIEAAIIDVQDGALKEIGFDWRLQGSRFDVRSTMSGANAGQNFDNSTLTRGYGPNLAIYAGSAALNFLSRIDALQTQSKASVLSRPKLATLNGSEAVLTNQEVLYPQIRGDRVAQLYQIDVGLKMRVVPVVVRRGGGGADIRLQIEIEDGSISSSREVGGIPVTNKSAITTQALVRNGESLLIGGYVRDTSDSGEAKVPLLGDIPLLGSLFRFRSANPRRMERLFLITPKLLAIAGTDDAPQEPLARDGEYLPNERRPVTSDVAGVKRIDEGVNSVIDGSNTAPVLSEDPNTVSASPVSAGGEN
ncbi:EscC/YscC/HrcC family type III secretion system outer membrane ring protein [Burkholderia cepacia]|uniref:EscC/YscC/HrcC family type III secretion system outer membrane ring protein n=1 Tax=Burkholderia cepacia TaxID=292 RepID=A0A2S8I0V6_BURCE|nr:type III secretion system outer membrane ring subunit SctC [Burkholderia cepacia]PQP08298.1 EscC/YscC/HrcC family type III secretion system outer membrane ring protein [Burkholderia cepacia]HDR9511846.1 type III secretion system outer membrane ring subunit SctC [Burkholderia cepacia]